jgi:putative transposase
MPNHWHMVVWPRDGQDREVSEFLRWLAATHAQRLHAHYGTSRSAKKTNFPR